MWKLHERCKPITRVHKQYVLGIIIKSVLHFLMQSLITSCTLLLIQWTGKKLLTRSPFVNVFRKRIRSSFLRKMYLSTLYKCTCLPFVPWRDSCTIWAIGTDQLLSWSLISSKYVSIISSLSNANNKHRVKSVLILSFFWSAFSSIQTEYRETRSISLYQVQMRENTD